MLSRAFHAWERRLANATRDRVVRPFDWGVDWLDGRSEAPLDPGPLLNAWTRAAMHDSAAFYAAEPAADYRLDGDTLTFSSAFVTPHPENNTVRARYFPARGRRRGPARRARDATVEREREGHVGLCRLLRAFGPVGAAPEPALPRRAHAARAASRRLHRQRQRRADDEVCRQAVLDARRAIAWLASQGYERIGILGTSLGSCLALLTTAHEPLVKAAAFNHVSPFFADVVWRGLSTAHVRAGLEGHVDLDRCASSGCRSAPSRFSTGCAIGRCCSCTRCTI